MKRILVAGLHHESNTFNPIITGIDDFRIYRKGEILAALNTGDSISGIINTLQAESDIEVIPILFARAVPNGVIDTALYLELKHYILTEMQKETAIDAITLSLHGSMRVQEIGEAEGDLIEAIRQLFPEIPIVSSLDMHATVTRRMLQHANAFVGYKQAPHTDCYETGAHAARLTIETLRTGKKLECAWASVPMIIAGEKTETSTEPMKSMIEALRKEEASSDILAASYLLGFPWADCPENRVSVLTVTLENRELAESRADFLADLFYRHRHQFTFNTEAYEPEIALKTALEAPEAPVYISDSGDNPTAGATADCTNFLKLILADPGVASLASPLLYAGIYDPAVVAACKNQVGETLSLSLGAAFDTRTSTPIVDEFLVEQWIPAWGTYRSDLALLKHGNVEIIVTGKHIGFIAPDLYHAFGIDQKQRKIIVNKLGYLTAFHKKDAARSILALTDGNSNERLERLPYTQVGADTLAYLGDKGV